MRTFLTLTALCLTLFLVGCQCGQSSTSASTSPGMMSECGPNCTMPCCDQDAKPCCGTCGGDKASCSGTCGGDAPKQCGPDCTKPCCADGACPVTGKNGECPKAGATACCGTCGGDAPKKCGPNCTKPCCADSNVSPGAVGDQPSDCGGKTCPLTGQPVSPGAVSDPAPSCPSSCDKK